MTLGSFADESPQQAKTFRDGESAKIDYLLTLPPGYDTDEDRRWPLVLFLHGRGESGENLERVKKHGPPKLVEDGRTFDFVLVAPQCPKSQWWQPAELLGLLDHLETTHRIDPDRIYVTGLSMGGYGTWALASQAPERFAAAVPICGGGDVALADTIGDLPVWAFHGTDDPVVPVEQTTRLVERLEERGGDVKLTLYPDVKHDSWTQTYDNPAVYEWMLSKRRSDRSDDPKQQNESEAPQ